MKITIWKIVYSQLTSGPKETEIEEFHKEITIPVVLIRLFFYTIQVKSSVLLVPSEIEEFHKAKKSSGLA